jgi:hypothetical protein
MIYLSFNIGFKVAVITQLTMGTDMKETAKISMEISDMGFTWLLEGISDALSVIEFVI